MIFPVKMKKLTVVLLREYTDDIARSLLELGCIDFITNPELQLYRDKDVNNSEELLRELIERVEIFLGMISRKEELPQKLTITDLQEINTDKFKRNLDRLAGALQKLRDEQRKIQEIILQQEEIQRQVEQLPDGVVSSGSTGLLDIHIGRISAVDFDSFSQAVSRTTSFLSETGNGDENSFFVLLTMNRERLLVEKILKQFNFDTSGFPSSIDCNRIYLIEKVTEAMDSFREKQDILNSDINRAIESKLDLLLGMWTDLSVNLLFIKVRSYFY